MNYIEIDGVGYLIFEDTENGLNYAVEAIKLESKYSDMSKFDKKVVDKLCKQLNN